MPDQVSDLLTKLRDQRFVDKFRKWSEELDHFTHIAYAGDVEGHQEWTQGNWTESLGLAYGVYGDWDGFDDVVRKMPPPHIVTSQELLQAFEVYLERKGIGITGGFDDVYEHYLDHVAHHLICRRISSAFPICRVILPLPKSNERIDCSFPFALGKLLGEAEILGRPVDPAAVQGLADKTIEANEPKTNKQIGFGLGNGIRVEPFLDYDRQDVRYSIETPTPSEATLTVQISWVCSPGALKAITDEISPTLKSAVLSAASLSLESSGTTTNKSDLPIISVALLRDQLPFIRFCVASLWTASPKVDSLDKRLANAVRLLREADKQTENSIGLALSITALEALVGRQEQGNSLTEVLATNVAILMEPELKPRNDAIAFIKTLYNKRSKALHGENIEGDSNIRGQARMLAAGVLKAVWEHFTSQSGAAKDEELFKMLRDRNREAGLPDGVLDSPVRSLWSKAQN